MNLEHNCTNINRDLRLINDRLFNIEGTLKELINRFGEHKIRQDDLLEYTANLFSEVAEVTVSHEKLQKRSNLWKRHFQEQHRKLSMRVQFIEKQVANLTLNFKTLSIAD